MPDAPEIYGQIIPLYDAKDRNGQPVFAVMVLAHGADGHIFDAAIFDDKWPGFREIA